MSRKHLIHCIASYSHSVFDRLYYSNLQLRYWPASDANTECLNSVTKGAVTHANTTTAIQQHSSAQASNAPGTYATAPDGYVYTYPSVYVAFPLVKAIDGCGTIGPSITSLTLAFAPGELSTVSGNNPGPIQGSTVAFNSADMPCGPENGTNDFLPNPTNVDSYQPIIALPSKLLALRPDWAKCTNDFFEGQDPPSALTPASKIAPFSAPPLPVTSVDPVAQTTPAAPSSSIAALPSSTSLAPKVTSSASTVQPLNTRTIESLASTSPDSTPLSIVSSTLSRPSNPQGGDLARDSSSLSSEYSSDSSDQSADPVAPVISLQTSIAASSNLRDPPAVVVAGQTVTENAAPISVHGNTIAYLSGQLYVGTDPDPVTMPALTRQTVNPVVIGSFTFTPVASPAFSIAVSDTDPMITPLAKASGIFVFHGQTITQGEGPITIDNIPITISEGSVYISGVAIPVSVATARAPPRVSPLIISATPAVIAGQTVSILGPSAVIVGSQTITIGQPVVTVSGQPVILGSSGLEIGSSMVQLPRPTSYVVIASETIALASSDIVIAGTTLALGSPALKINGTLVSLGSSILVVGTETETFAPTSGMAAPTSGGIGALIMSGLGAVGGSEISSPTITGNSTFSSIVPFAGVSGNQIGTHSYWLNAIRASICLVIAMNIWS